MRSLAAPLRRLVPAILLLSCLASPARGIWPHTPFTNLPINIGDGDQIVTGLASDGAYGVFIAWTDPSGQKVRVQHIDAQGELLWDAAGITVAGTSGGQYNATCVADGSGGVYVVWQDRRSALDYDIYAQRLTGGGVAQWTANGVALCTATGDQSYPVATRSGTGGLLVGWQDDRAGSNAYDVRAQAVSGTGTILWNADGTDVCSQTGIQLLAGIVADGSGGAILAWEDRRAIEYKVYAQRVNTSGRVEWATNGIPVCGAAGYQASPRVVTDGSGGAILDWQDSRSGGLDVYAQRVNGSGAVQWTATGKAVCALANNQYLPALLADGGGGAFVAWADGRTAAEDIYAQHLDATGAPLWAADGVAVTTAAGQQMYAALVPDALGGVIVAWNDSRNGCVGLYAQRISFEGLASWTANGVAVAVSPNYYDQLLGYIEADGVGGAVLAWMRYGNGYDAYAQRLFSTGLLGPAAPSIDDVRDVPNDQGGAVQVMWTGSGRDAWPDYSIESYALWRQLDVAAAQAALARGARRAGAAPAPGELRTSGDGAQATYWEFIASIPGRGSEAYAYTVVTASDSTEGAIPWNRFVVDAREGSIPAFYSSAADSGYSVDNLAPAMPAPFTGTYAGGTASLRWGASAAPDLFAFRLHRGTTAGFTPGPGNLVATQQETAYDDAAGAPRFYKLCAVDVHGNVSPYAFLQPTGTADVAAALPRELALSSPAPNPLRSGATLRLALPHDADVALAVLDAQGRRVRTLLAGAQPAGEHAITWDGRDDGSRRVADGIYVVRLACEGRVITRRIAALR
jgi:hypothetical protein